MLLFCFFFVADVSVVAGGVVAVDADSAVVAVAAAVRASVAVVAVVATSVEAPSTG